jgi:ribose transport system substrate-binding protein
LPITKNRTNPAYEAARLGADRVAARLGAGTVHYVPEKPDDIDEQIALIARAIAQRPDAAVFVPVHETAVNDALLGFDAACIPLFNFVTRTTAGQRLCRARRSLLRRISRATFSPRCPVAARSSSSRERLFRHQPRPAHRISALTACPDIARRCVASISATSRVVFSAAADQLRAWTRCLRQRCHGAGRAGCAGARWQRPLVVGVNAIPEAVTAIAAGRMLATVSFDAMAMSAVATDAAIRHLRGETFRTRSSCRCGSSTPATARDGPCHSRRLLMAELERSRPLTAT